MLLSGSALLLEAHTENPLSEMVDTESVKVVSLVGDFSALIVSIQ